MRPVTQNCTDHARTRRSRSHLEEDAHAVAIHRFDCRRIIDRVESLSQDRLGGTVVSHFVSFAESSRVEADTERRGRWQAMQLAISVRDFAYHRAMHRS